MSCRNPTHVHDFLKAKQDRNFSFTSKIEKISGQDPDIGAESDAFGISVMLLVAFACFRIMWIIAKSIHRQDGLGFALHRKTVE